MRDKICLSAATAYTEWGTKISFFFVGTTVVIGGNSRSNRYDWCFRSMNIRTGHQDQCYKIQDEYAAEVLHVANLTFLGGFCWVTMSFFSSSGHHG